MKAYSRATIAVSLRLSLDNTLGQSYDREKLFVRYLEINLPNSPGHRPIGTRATPLSARVSAREICRA